VSLIVTITAETGRAFVPFLRRHVRAAYDVLQARRGKRLAGRFPLREMSLALVNDVRMGEVHEEFMGIHGPTDVLTFPIDEDASGRVTSGEVIVCVPQARRQAKLHRIPPRLELLLYAIHGMLHLLGYDDRTPRDFRDMHAIEDDILAKLGFGPVFAASGGSDTPVRHRPQADPARRQNARRLRRVSDKRVRPTTAPSRRRS
jgi:probable rRNA maturation factor